MNQNSPLAQALLRPVIVEGWIQILNQLVDGVADEAEVVEAFMRGDMVIIVTPDHAWIAPAERHGIQPTDRDSLPGASDNTSGIV